MSDEALIAEVRGYLRSVLDEWLGNDYPQEGTEDHQTWQTKLQAIQQIETVEDVLAYAAQFERDEEEFLSKWGL